MKFEVACGIIVIIDACEAKKKWIFFPLYNGRPNTQTKEERKKQKNVKEGLFNWNLKGQLVIMKENEMKR